MFSHVIIIEVDENQHNGYDGSCENERLMLISQDLAYRPIVFIKFNPDSYINENGVKITSPWKKTTTGISLSDKSTLDWNDRLDVLVEKFNYWCENVPEKTITIEKLFFTESC